MEDFLTGKKHVHFIGIGGSGMYPLAQILHSKGFYLTGSDNNETETLKAQYGNTRIHGAESRKYRGC